MTGRMSAVAALIVAVLAGCRSAPVPQAAGPEPSPRFSPADVVRIQVDALKENGEGDQGIEIVFRFASPANRSVTGPLPRFAAMIRSPLYQPMVNHLAARYDDVEVSGELARQQVAIATRDGWVVVYVFLLRRQTEGAYAGCWMTEGVTAVNAFRLPQGRTA